MNGLTPCLRSLSSRQVLRQAYHVQPLPPAAAAVVSISSPSSSSSTSSRISNSNGASRRRPFSVLNRPPPNYPGHVPLTTLERAALAVGSGIVSIVDVYRHDMIAALGEATATPYFIERLRRAMLSSSTGRRILRARPRLTSATLDVPRLRTLPANTVGATYAAWLDREGVSPDTRDPVRYIDDEECAYVMQRYRESHDFYHALTGLPVVREGEIALKAFEFANTLLPMTGLSMLAVATLKPAERKRFWSIYAPWAIRNGLRSDEVINVYWEEEMETDVDELRARLGIERPPDLRDIRKREREEKKRLKEAAAAQAVAS
ncbi:Coq4-domain-containing protein [Hypoxylon sp. NC1633]|nr:Coq4-domain-containing protein [Hypoxylon sp. NC1633]